MNMKNKMGVEWIWEIEVWLDSLGHVIFSSEKITNFIFLYFLSILVMNSLVCSFFLFSHVLTSPGNFNFFLSSLSPIWWGSPSLVMIDWFAPYHSSYLIAFFLFDLQPFLIVVNTIDPINSITTITKQSKLHVLRCFPLFALLALLTS